LLTEEGGSSAKVFMQITSVIQVFPGWVWNVLLFISVFYFNWLCNWHDKLD